MAYITREDYSCYNGTIDIPASDFATLSNRASDLIDIITQMKIVADGFENLSASIQTIIKKACCAQVEYLYTNGGNDAMNGNGNNTVNSESLGKWSQSYGKTNTKNIGGIPISPLTTSLLAYTGYLYQGISMVDIRGNAYETY